MRIILFFRGKSNDYMVIWEIREEPERSQENESNRNGTQGENGQINHKGNCGKR